MVAERLQVIGKGDAVEIGGLLLVAVVVAEKLLDDDAEIALFVGRQDSKSEKKPSSCSRSYGAGRLGIGIIAAPRPLSR